MIAALFSELRRREELALMPYLLAGYPNLERSMEHLQTMDAAGADIIELGVPYSDPVADGPVIQDAAHAALQSGVTLRAILDAVERRPPNAPLILMSYLGPLLAFGQARLLDRLRGIGFAGLIIPDLPLEESDSWRKEADNAGLALVPMVAPTSAGSRLQRIVDGARGFIYYVSVTGTTGTRQTLGPHLIPGLRQLREQTDLPLTVGFGISQPEQIRELAGHTDGVVVGSRLVQAIRDGEELQTVVEALKQATRRAAC